MSKELKSRIAGRKWGDDIINVWVHPAFVDESMDIEDFKHGAARAFREFSDSILGQPYSESRVMSDSDAKRYESNCIRFGKYLGTPIKDIPLEYLQWLADAQNELVAYLKSDVGRKRESE